MKGISILLCLIFVFFRLCPIFYGTLFRQLVALSLVLKLVNHNYAKQNKSFEWYGASTDLCDFTGRTA